MNICESPAKLIGNLALYLYDATRRHNRSRVEWCIKQLRDALKDYEGQMSGVTWIDYEMPKKLVRGNCAPHVGIIPGNDDPTS